MKYLKRYNENFKGFANVDTSQEAFNRCQNLSEDEFLKILRENCKNFSLSNDLLYRNKEYSGDFQLFKPYKRRTNPVTFPKFFNRIEDDSNYPVKRKLSLIGGTNPSFISDLFRDKMASTNSDSDFTVYIVIPFDNSKIVFCPAPDLLFLDRTKEEYVSGEPVSDKNFVMVEYTKDFKIPEEELSKLPGHKSFSQKTRNGTSHSGYEFFTSSNCLLIHESYIDILNQI
jgi:hypothetical protein